MDRKKLWDMHAYVFTYRPGERMPVYERTFPAACLEEAWEWINRSRYRGFISIGCLPQHYWR